MRFPSVWAGASRSITTTVAALIHWASSSSAAVAAILLVAVLIVSGFACGNLIIGFAFCQGVGTGAG